MDIDSEVSRAGATHHKLGDQQALLTSRDREEAEMLRVKTPPAVLTAVVSAVFLVILAWAPAPASAAAEGSEDLARFAHFDTRSAKLDRQIHRLAQRPHQARINNRLQRRLLFTNASLIRMNRSLADLSRAVLSAPELTDEFVQGVLDCNHIATELDRDALRLDKRALRARHASLRSTVRSAHTQLRSLSATIRDQRPRKPKPTPTPTVIPTPTPTPTVTPTPTPTPDPAGPSVPAGYTLVQGQTINNLVTNGLSNRYYYKCTFTGGSATSAVLSFTGTSANLIFDSCTIARGGGWNGVTINDASGRVHDITFSGCLFKAQARMGFECTSRPTTASTQYQRINILNSTFEPQGNEAVSYDGGAAAGNCTFSGNVIQGAGNDPSQTYGASFEINGPSNMTVTGNRILQCRGSLLNLQMHTTSDCGWVFTDNVFDASQRLQSTAMSASSQVVLGFNVYGGQFARNTMVSAAPGGGVAYLSNCRNMDWRTSGWRDATSRAGYATPTQVGGCTSNQF